MFNSEQLGLAKHTTSTLAPDSQPVFQSPSVKTEVAAVKTEVAAVKTEVAAVKTEVAEIKTEVAEVKTELDATSVLSSATSVLTSLTSSATWAMDFTFAEIIRPSSSLPLESFLRWFKQTLFAI